MMLHHPHLISSYISVISHLLARSLDLLSYVVFIFFWIICHTFSAYYVAELSMTKGSTVCKTCPIHSLLSKSDIKE